MKKIMFCIRFVIAFFAGLYWRSKGINPMDEMVIASEETVTEMIKLQRDIQQNKLSKEEMQAKRDRIAKGFEKYGEFFDLMETLDIDPFYKRKAKEALSYAKQTEEMLNTALVGYEQTPV